MVKNTTNVPLKQKINKQFAKRCCFVYLFECQKIKGKFKKYLINNCVKKI